MASKLGASDLHDEDFGSIDRETEAGLSTPLAIVSPETLDAGKPVWTLNHIISNFERPGWAYSASTIEYSFPTDPPAGANSDWTDGWQPFSDAQKAAAVSIFQLFSDVCGLTFVEVPDNGQMPGADNHRIIFSNSTSIAHYGFTSYAGVGGGTASDPSELYGASIWISSAPKLPPPTGYQPGDNWFRSLMHEMLHSMGLPHPGPYDSSAGPSTYENDARYFQDSLQYTNLSYFEETKTGADFGHDSNADYYVYHGSGWSTTPMLHDIAALQAMYGANTSTRADDTTYGFNSTADRASYDFSVNAQPVFCIWDGGGIDTLDCSGFSRGAQIDLRQGAFSSIAGLTWNISIAYGAVIENAIGGSGADTLTGNGSANTLIGGGRSDQLIGGRGADVLRGGAGSDLFVFTSVKDSLTGVKGRDLIADLGAGDRIDLSAIDADKTLAGDQAFHLIEGAFTHQAGELRLQWNAVSGETLLSGDINGDSRADFTIRITGDHHDSTDFVL